LQAQGAEVHAVESSAAAQEAFALRAPDIIVSDIGLAGEDGYVLLRTIRASEQQRGSARIPAVALTAFARRTDSAPPRRASTRTCPSQWILRSCSCRSEYSPADWSEEGGVAPHLPTWSPG